MLTIEAFTELKQRVAGIQRDYDRATGAAQQLRQRLLDEHGCKTTKQAERLLIKLQQETEREEKQFAKALRLFEQEMERHE